jgi:hypothetical protein
LSTAIGLFPLLLFMAPPNKDIFSSDFTRKWSRYSSGIQWLGIILGSIAFAWLLVTVYQDPRAYDLPEINPRNLRFIFISNLLIYSLAINFFGNYLRRFRH